MEVLFSLLTLLGLLAAEPGVDSDSSRSSALRTALDSALMLHASSKAGLDTRSIPARDESAAASERALTRDLTYMELDSGFLARTCVCEPREVRAMRLMVTYAGLLRLLGVPDPEIERRLVDRAGDRGPRLRQLFDVGGLDGIAHFICVDYLRAALALDIPADELRGYVEQAADGLAESTGSRPQPRRTPDLLAAVD